MPAETTYLVAGIQSTQPSTLMGAVGMTPLEVGRVMFEGLPRDQQRVGEIKRTFVVDTRKMQRCWQEVDERYGTACQGNGLPRNLTCSAFL